MTVTYNFYITDHNTNNLLCILFTLYIFLKIEFHVGETDFFKLTIIINKTKACV